MKTIKVVLAALVMAVSTSSFAKTENKSDSSSELDVTIQAQIDGRVIVGFEKLEDEKVFIEIFDKTGTLIHAEKIKDHTIVLKRFDLSNFPAGNYSYVVSNAKFSVKKTIEKK